MIPDELSELITHWIDQAKREDPGSSSANGDALLIYSDMGGSCFLKPDGTVLIGAHDSDESSRVEATEDWLNVP